MPGRSPGHPRISGQSQKTWMAGTCPAMTRKWLLTEALLCQDGASRRGGPHMRAWITVLVAASVALAAGTSVALSGWRSEVPVYPPYPYKAGHYPTAGFLLRPAALRCHQPALLPLALLYDGARAQPLPLYAAHLPRLRQRRRPQIAADRGLRSIGLGLGLSPTSRHCDAAPHCGTGLHKTVLLLPYRAPRRRQGGMACGPFASW